MGNPRARPLSPHWPTLLLRGLLAIAFSVIAWARPGPTLAVPLVLAGAYLFVDGIFALAAAIRASRRDESFAFLAIEGVLGILLGAFALARPVHALAVAFVVVGFWALFTGFLELLEASRLRRHVPNEWLLAVSGLLRMAFGIVLILRPGAGVLTLLWIAAAYALLEGIVLIALSLRLRRVAHGRVDTTGARPTGVTPQPA